jgi:hypothetical protein
VKYLDLKNGVVLVAYGPVERRARMDTAPKYGVYGKVELPGQLHDHQLLKKKTVPWIVTKKKFICMLPENNMLRFSS